MTDAASDLQAAVAVISRVLKITEPAIQTAHGELKLAPSDIQSLRFIAEHPGCMASALADHLGVVPTTATSIVDRLVKRDFVHRARPEDNRRAIALTLTAAGQDAFTRIDADEKATMTLMLDALPQADRAAFVTAMERIAAHLSSMR